MSRKTKQNFICPYCGKNVEEEMYELVIVEEDEKNLEMLLNGDVFNATCPHCKQKVTWPHNLIVHGLANKYILCYLTEMDEELIKIENPFKLDGEYRYRLVTNMAELIEKVVAFETNVDDKIIELIKHEIYEKEEDKENIVKFIFNSYDKKKEALLFQSLTKDKSAIISVYAPLEKYMGIQELISGNEFFADTLRFEVIDQKWAKEALELVK